MSAGGNDGQVVTAELPGSAAELTSQQSAAAPELSLAEDDGGAGLGAR